MFNDANDIITTSGSIIHMTFLYQNAIFNYGILFHHGIHYNNLQIFVKISTIWQIILVWCLLLLHRYYIHLSVS